MLQVQAVGLNFRDVLLVLGEYPDAKEEDPGSDCSALVVEHETEEADGRRRRGGAGGYYYRRATPSSASLPAASPPLFALGPTRG